MRLDAIASGTRSRHQPWRRAAECLAGCLVVALIAVLCFNLRLSFPTPTFLCLVVLVVVSLQGSFLSSVVVSLAASGFLDYYFIPPLFTLHVGEPADIVAVVAFLVTSLVITRLVIQVRRLMEERLRLTEAYLTEAQQLSHTGSFGWNVASGETTWSDETFNILEYDRRTEASVGRVLDRVHPQDLPHFRAAMERAVLEGKDWEFEYRLQLAEGRIKHLHVVARATRDAAGRLAFVGALMDVTGRNQAEESLRIAQANLAHASRLTTVGELTASIAHEVNQPFAAVVTNANACLRWLNHDPPNLVEVREAVQRIVRDGNRGGEIIARIRSMLKKGAMAKSRVDLNEVIRETITMAGANLRGTEMRMDLEPGLPAVMADRVLLQQVLLNLTMNALDAMKPVTGKPHLLHIGTAHVSDDIVQVLVGDTGTGLTQEARERLFESFYTTKPGGLGLGLAICRSIIQSHGGRLWVESTREGGTEFQFTLPIEGGSAE